VDGSASDSNDFDFIVMLRQSLATMSHGITADLFVSTFVCFSPDMVNTRYLRIVKKAFLYQETKGRKMDNDRHGGVSDGFPLHPCSDPP
jgi:hypothetical protein